MNSYYGVKDQEYNTSFIEAKWLTPYEVLQQLELKPNTHLATYLNACQSQPPRLIYPNELIYSSNGHTPTAAYSNNPAGGENDSRPQYLIDAILIAKLTSSSPAVATHPSNVVRLKSVLLSQLLASPHEPLLILSLPKDTYRWSKVANVNLMPSNALRVGFDTVARQFAYIGRLKLDHLLRSAAASGGGVGGQQHRQVVMSLSCQQSSNSNLFGSLINVYEYIPAILMQLNDISSLNNHNWLASNSDAQGTSMWSRIRQTASNRLPSFVVSSLSSTSNNNYYTNNNNIYPSSAYQPYSSSHHYNNHHHHHQQQQHQPHPPIDFNLTTTNYEVLCLQKQPASLKQLATQQLIRLDEESERHALAIRSLSNSIRSLIVPAHLLPGQCVIRHAKMRSSSSVYELGVSGAGVLRFVKREDGERQVATVEKYVESLLVLKSGVYLVFDSNQTRRRPLVLYQHRRSNLYTATMSDAFYVELTNDGYLRVTNASRVSQDIYNLNEYFQPSSPLNPTSSSSIVNGGGEFGADEKLLLNNQQQARMIVRQDSLININLRLFLDDLRSLPVKIMNIVISVIKSVVATVFYRRTRVSRRAL